VTAELSVLPPYYRRLPWGIVVRLDGCYNDAGEPDAAQEDPEQPVGRVVVELPDFMAEALSHMIETIWDVGERLTGSPPCLPDPIPDRDLAEALHAAAISQPGSQCRCLSRRRHERYAVPASRTL
jgi:hypothetical protein